MRHRKKGKVLDRKKAGREALLKSLALGLVTNKKIKTTIAKAKILRTFIEPLVTKAKSDTLANRRYLLKFLPVNAVDVLIKEIAPALKNRPGGYTRVIKGTWRKGDGAEVSIIEFVAEFNQEKKETVSKKSEKSEKKEVKKTKDTKKEKVVDDKKTVKSTKKE